MDQLLTPIEPRCWRGSEVKPNNAKRTTSLAAYYITNPTYELFMATSDERVKIAKDTINRSAKITEEHASEGATLDSKFIADQLPPLDPAKCPNTDHVPVDVEILKSDSFTAARNIMKDDTEALGKIAVLNLASNSQPGGGWPWAVASSKTQVGYIHTY